MHGGNQIYNECAPANDASYNNGLINVLMDNPRASSA